MALPVLFNGEPETKGHPDRGWPALGRPHFVQWGALRGVLVGVSLAVLDFAVGVLGAEERRNGGMSGVKCCLLEGTDNAHTNIRP